jgi:CheY-like chemotaxis protein
VDVTLAHRDGAVEVRVADTGVGIEGKFLPFVFDRFRQADSSLTRAHGGLGLGLAVVLHLSQIHGGSVRAESPGPGQGASFTVRLPSLASLASPGAPAVVEARRPPDPVEAEAAPTSGVQLLDGVRVLVVDDDDDARELLREVLLQHRADVTIACSARDALAGIDAQKPHVLVSDIAMKGEDGYDLIRKLRRRPPQQGGDVPALALTACTREEDRVRAIEAGFQMHANKPVDPFAVVEAVASLARAAGVLGSPKAG